ncbi:MAG: hypothetical protein ABT940_12335 [Alphaproteobacteria bacterium]
MESCKSCERLATAEAEVSGQREDIRRMMAMLEALREDIQGLRLEYATARGALGMARWLWGAAGAVVAATVTLATKLYGPALHP